MRTTIALAAAALAAALAPAAQAARLPSTSQPGVTARALPANRAEIRFADTKAGRAAYKRVAGHTIDVRCQKVGAHALGAEPSRRFTTRLRMPRRLSTVRLVLRGDLNFCFVGSPFGGLTLGLDSDGRAFLADFQADIAAQAVAGEAFARLARAGRAPSAATVVRPFRRVAAVLSSAGAMPPRNRVGVYSDRTHHLVVAARSATGRRIFFERDGDVTSTNTAGLLEQLDRAPSPAGVSLPGGPIPPPGSELPAATDPGITAQRSGRTVTVSLSTAARSKYAVERARVNCNRVRGDVLQEGFGRDTEPPAAGEPLRFDLETGFHVCALGDTAAGPVAYFAVDPASRAQLEEALVAAALERVIHTAGDAAAPGYPSGAALAGSFDDAIVALSGPDATTQDLRVGVWSDGLRRLVVTAVARTGRRLFARIDGQTLTTNMLGIPNLAAG